MALFSLNIEAEGRQQIVFAMVGGSAADARDAFSEETDGVVVTNVQTVDDDKWYSTDREGIMVTQEEGDVEYAEPILSSPLITVWGTDSAQDLIVTAGVSAGYQQHADKLAYAEEAANEALQAAAGEEGAVVAVLSRDVLDTIRLALDSEHTRLLYVKGKAHSRLAERGLRDEIEAVSFALSAVEGVIADHEDNG